MSNSAFGVKLQLGGDFRRCGSCCGFGLLHLQLAIIRRPDEQQFAAHVVGASEGLLVEDLAEQQLVCARTPAQVLRMNCEAPDHDPFDRLAVLDDRLLGLH